MPRLVIISERTRYHFQKPLEYFSNLEIVHLYKFHYPDMDPAKFPNMIRYHNIFQLYRKLVELKPDIIQGLEPYYGYSRFKIPLKVLPIIATTYLYSRIQKIPYFFHILENILPEQKYGLLAGALMKKIAQIYARGAKFIFYLNQGAKKNLLHLGVNNHKIFSGLWGIWGLNTNVFAPLLKAKSYQLKAILFVGRLIRQKGVWELMEAYKNIVEKYPNTRLIIVGSGPLRKKLQVTSYKLQVEFIGQITNDQVPQYYQSAYLTVSPTRSLKYSAEQIGMTNIESMACGTPVISTFSGSIPEYVIDGQTGLLVAENDPKSLEKAISKLIDNENLRNQLARNCWGYALKHFDAKRNVQWLEQFILRKMKNEPTN